MDNKKEKKLDYVAIENATKEFSDKMKSLNANYILITSLGEELITAANISDASLADLVADAIDGSGGELLIPIQAGCNLYRLAKAERLAAKLGLDSKE
jgi:hypothetical protein